MAKAILALVALYFFAAISVALAAVISPNGAVSSNSITINAHYPDDKLQNGDILTLRGDGLGLNWNSGVNMQRTTDNLWQITLQYPASAVGSSAKVKVLLNDFTWMVGANAVFVLTSGTNNNVDIYPWFYIAPGTIEYINNVYSPQLQNTRNITLYVPPSYYQNTLKNITNVLVMHDGQNLFNRNTAFMGNPWYCQATLDALITGGLTDEVLIVGVYNTPDRIDELTYSYDPSQQAGGKGDLYLDFIEDTVLPAVRSQYRIDTEKATLGILGSSLGGLISCYAGWTRSNVYSKAGCMSSSFWWNNQDFNNTILVKDSSPVPQLSKLYIDSGNAGVDDDDVVQTQTVRDHILSAFSEYYKLNQNLFYYLDQGGQHNEYYWGKRFHVPMTYMYPPPVLPVTSRA